MNPWLLAQTLTMLPEGMQAKEGVNNIAIDALIVKLTFSLRLFSQNQGDDDNEGCCLVSSRQNSPQGRKTTGSCNINDTHRLQKQICDTIPHPEYRRSNRRRCRFR